MFYVNFAVRFNDKEFVSSNNAEFAVVSVKNGLLYWVPLFSHPISAAAYPAETPSLGAGLVKQPTHARADSLDAHKL